MKAVIHKTGAIGDVLGIERRDGKDYVYFENGLSLPVSEVGFLNPYEQYEADNYDWQAFRREAAKEILCAYLNGGLTGGGSVLAVKTSIDIADELIRQLKEEPK